MWNLISVETAQNMQPYVCYKNVQNINVSGMPLADCCCETSLAELRMTQGNMESCKY